MTSKTDWEEKISKVFDRKPRNGANPKNQLWLIRKEERATQYSIAKPNIHLCIDGPTGTGKSSLAITALARARVGVKSVQVTRNMTWPEFCRILVTKEMEEGRLTPKLGVGTKAGLQAGLPLIEGQVTLEVERQAGKSVQEVAEGWSESDACKAMVNQHVALMIDDFEKANRKLLIRISDMGKLLTQSFTSSISKLVIVGTGDIYRRLLEADKSLEGRIDEISLGTFPEERHDYPSWTYLVRGFAALGLRFHPGSADLRRTLGRQANSAELLQDDERDHERCMRAVFEAADGLPKSLTELGYDITIELPPDTSTVSASRIIDKTKEMFRSKVIRVKQKYPSLRKELRKDLFTRRVLAHLLNSGPGKIHFLSNLVMELGQELSESEITEAVEKLGAIGILVQTGHNGDTLFFDDLPLAHTLRILAADPRRCHEYGIDPKIFAQIGQIMLPLDWDSQGHGMDPITLRFHF